MVEQIISFAKTTGAYQLFGNLGQNWKSLVMIIISLFILYLGIKKKFEPLLLVGIAFGMLLANLPGANLTVQYHDLQGFVELVAHGRALNEETGQWVAATPGLMDFLYFGVKTGIYPPLIFLGIGAMTDFTSAIYRTSCQRVSISRVCVIRQVRQLGLITMETVHRQVQRSTAIIVGLDLDGATHIAVRTAIKMGRGKLFLKGTTQPHQSLFRSTTLLTNMTTT